MPKFLNYKPRSTEYSRNRGDRQRVWGYSGFFDPFSYVQGTGPEKIVYDQLSRRGIRFWFQNEVAFSIPELEFNKDYRPDFVLPDQKVIIEVQGSYWHSKPEAIETDAYKMAVYEMTGWRVLAWWDFEIEADVVGLFARDLAGIGAYNMANTASTETSNGRKVVRDDSKGIRTMNYQRGQRLAYKKPSIKLKTRKIKNYGRYTV